MIDYILSKSLKEYQKQNNISFTDSEIATMIYNSDCCLWEIYESLQELASKTKDEKLQQQIKERIEDTKRCWNAFITNNDNAVYRLKCYEKTDGEYLEEGYYWCFKDAQVAAQLFNSKYKIEKYRVFLCGQEAVQEYRKNQYISSKVGEVRCEPDGTMTYLWSNEYTRVAAVDSDSMRFEEQYVPIRYPFRKGDIVQDILSGDIGIVNCTANDEEMEERIRIRKQWGDFTDVTLFVEVPDEEGQFWHAYFRPTELEFFDINQLDGQKKVLLMHAAEVVKGHGTLEYLNRLQREMEEENRKRKLIV